MTGRGVVRSGALVTKEGRPVGRVTSGTMVPYWKMVGEGLSSHLTEEYELRSICLALMDSDVLEDDHVEIEVRDKAVDGVVVPYHLRTDAAVCPPDCLSGPGRAGACASAGLAEGDAESLAEDVR